MEISEAYRLRDVGMVKAALHANDAAPGWSDVAYLFLERYARCVPYFISEDVSDASVMWGLIQPPTLKAWGMVYRNAVKRGVIVQDGAGRSRRRHASICPRWKSLTYKGKS